MTKLLLKKYFSEIEYLINSINMDEVLNLKNKIVRTKKLKGKSFILGNGGSSSTANHFAVDMTKNANIETISFSNDNLISCFSNDYGFNDWMKKALKFYVKKKDFVIFLSVSGKSKNIVNAIKHCNRNKISHFSLTGHKKNNSVNKLSKKYLWVNSMSYNAVEIVHSVVLLNIIDLIIGKNIYSSKR